MKDIICRLVLFFFTLLSQSVQAQSYVPEQHNAKIKIKPVVPIKAYAFNLADVRLTTSIFSKAMELDAAYLLSLKPDRFLYRFRLNAGLAPKDSIYGGWESQGVSGHSLGHYLSACAMMYASSGNKLFKQRVDYIVGELALCQQLRKTGYVGGIPHEDSIFAQVSRGDINSAGFDLNGGWVPWYTIHKLLAGLADAYLYCDNKQALAILEKFAGWISNTTKNLDQEQWQKMLAAEHGGMNEVLANLYAFTGNRMHLELSRKFYHHQVLDALAQQKDELAGKHANTQIPKIIGMARLYELTAAKNDKTIANFFWHTVVQEHSYVIGGNSDYEHFSAPGKLNDHLSTNTTETCNTYNMLKLTRHLFSWQPNAAYMDYYERALYNHILASQNNQDGMMCYYVPLQAGTSKQFNTPFESFWCCTGSGMENHVKYGEQIYSAGTDGSLYVNLFIPSVLQWKARGLSVEQQTNYPSTDKTQVVIHSNKPQAFTVKLRKPGWATSVWVKINNQSISPTIDADGFIIIKRTWKDNDKIELRMPMQVYTESIMDNPDRVAFLYGPLVLAGVLPAASENPMEDVPVLVADKNSLATSLHKKGNAIAFSTNGISKPYSVNMIPFYAINNERQMVYFDIYSNQQWLLHKAEIEAAKKLAAEIESRTTDHLRIGEMQPERDHNLQGENTFSGQMGEYKWRDARDGGWFSFDMKLAGGDTKQILRCQYWGSDGGGRVFDILVNGEKIATETLTASNPNKFIYKEYAIPNNFTLNKELVTVKIQAHPGKTAGGLFDCKIIRAEE